MDLGRESRNLPSDDPAITFPGEHSNFARKSLRRHGSRHDTSHDDDYNSGNNHDHDNDNNHDHKYFSSPQFHFPATVACASCSQSVPSVLMTQQGAKSFESRTFGTDSSGCATQTLVCASNGASSIPEIVVRVFVVVRVLLSKGGSSNFMRLTRWTVKK